MPLTLYPFTPLGHTAGHTAEPTPGGYLPAPLRAHGRNRLHPYHLRVQYDKQNSFFSQNPSRPG